MRRASFKISDEEYTVRKFFDEQELNEYILEVSLLCTREHNRIAITFEGYRCSAPVPGWFEDEVCSSCKWYGDRCPGPIEMNYDV